MSSSLPAVELAIATGGGDKGGGASARIAPEEKFLSPRAMSLDAINKQRVKPQDLMFSWKNVSVSSITPPEEILSDVSGFVVRGGITAVIGASSSGKSLLLKALSGRIQLLDVSGEAALDGEPIKVKSLKNSITYVPQEELLVGELTLRETLLTSALMRNDKPREQVERDVQAIIDNLGLKKVGDNVIGTILKRGLSGGEKRRTSVGIELVNTPSVVLLDEPTSGLDATAAFMAIETIKKLVRDSNRTMSVILTIHQPNLRILSLFDHLLVLGNRSMVYFGTVRDAVGYFARIDMPVPARQTPSDHFLACVDAVTQGSSSRGSDGGGHGIDVNFDFASSWTASQDASAVHGLIDRAARLRSEEFDFREENPDYGTSRFTQFKQLLVRNFRIATRDITLYYLQIFLHMMYGFLVGACFLDLPQEIGARVQDIPAAVTWLSFLNSYIQVFKVHYLENMNELFHHERANNSYSVLAFWAADFVNTALFSLIFVPGITVGYFMIGLPSDAFPLFLLITYLFALVAEACVHVISQFTSNKAYAIVAAQGFFVVFSLFAGGTFVRWDDVPGWWVWLQEIGVYTQFTRAMLLTVFDKLTYTCATNTISGSACIAPGQGDGVFACVSGSVSGNTCQVEGREVLRALKGVSLGEDKWDFFGYSILFLIVAKGLLYLLLRFPPKTIAQRWRNWHGEDVGREILHNKITTKRLQRTVSEMRSQLVRLDPRHNAASRIQRWYRRHLRSIGFEAEDSRPLARQDSVHFSRKSREYVLEWRNVTLTLPSNGKVLLDHVSGQARPGVILGLMGPSGAGKTTMLNALSGRATYAKVTGEVLFGGRPLTREVMSYVPQHDDLNGFFTVRETLDFQARLKLASLSNKERYFKIRELLAILGLKDFADVRVQELSGGLLKKLSIGIGLVSDPLVLFLDEPTTGLDSAAALNIVSYVRRVAKRLGFCAVMSIHQPAYAVFRELEEIILLENGRIAFEGTVSDAVRYFDELDVGCPDDLNPADHYLDVISVPPLKNAGIKMPSPRLIRGKDEPEPTWKEVFLGSRYHREMEPGKEMDQDLVTDQPSEFDRHLILVERLLKYYWREPGIYLARTIEILVIAFFVGTIFVRVDRDLREMLSLSGSLFYNVWCVLFAVVASATSFVVDRRHVRNDFMAGAYTHGTYCISQFVASLPFTILGAVLYQAVFHFLVGFNDAFEAFVYAVLVTILLLLMMEGIVLSVVEALKNAMLSVTFSMVVLGTLFLFPGFFVKTGDMPVWISWFSYIVPTRYAFTGLLINVFDGQDYFNPQTPTVAVKGSEILVSIFDQDKDENKWVQLVIMIAWTVAFRVLHYAILEYGVKDVKGAIGGGAAPDDEEKRRAPVIEEEKVSPRESEHDDDEKEAPASANVQ